MLLTKLIYLAVYSCKEIYEDIIDNKWTNWNLIISLRRDFCVVSHHAQQKRVHFSSYTKNCFVLSWLISYHWKDNWGNQRQQHSVSSGLVSGRSCGRKFDRCCGSIRIRHSLSNLSIRWTLASSSPSIAVQPQVDSNVSFLINNDTAAVFFVLLVSIFGSSFCIKIVVFCVHWHFCVQSVTCILGASEQIALFGLLFLTLRTLNGLLQFTFSTNTSTYPCHNDEDENHWQCDADEY